MKRPKPGFSVYIKTRLTHPLKRNKTLVYETGKGDRFQDVGSIHTALIPMAIIFLWLICSFILNLTLIGELTILVLLILHRIFRYFWTDFETAEEDFNTSSHGALLEAGNDDSEGRVIKDNRRIRCAHTFIIFEIVLIVAVLSCSALLAGNSPYSRKMPESPEILSLENSDYSTVSAYEIVRLYMDKFCPEAQLTDYGAGYGENGTLYDFTFKNPMKGIFANKIYKSLCAFIDTEENKLTIYYFCNYIPWSSYRTKPEPFAEPAAEKIKSIVISEAAVNPEDINSIYIGTSFPKYQSDDNFDPGGDTWAVVIEVDGEDKYYTVNLAEKKASLFY
jgi:hypothetical protein